MKILFSIIGCLQAAHLYELARQLLEVLIALVRQGRVAADGTVGGPEVKHRLAGILRHGHQTTVVAEAPQARRVWRGHSLRLLAEHGLVVSGRDPLHPLRVVFYRAVKRDASSGRRDDEVVPRRYIEEEQRSDAPQIVSLAMEV
jgi:hypothetical protein